MDKKFKLLAASSLVAALATGCTPYNARTGTYDSSEYGTGASQNSQPTNTACSTCRSNPTPPAEHTQQWYIDRWNRDQNKATYTPPRRTYTPPRRTTYTADGHSQQWYIDRWNRQQQTQANKSAPAYVPPAKTHTGYGVAKPYTPPPAQVSSNYYDVRQQTDYSTTNKKLYTGSNAATKKELYTGNNAASKKEIYSNGGYNNKSYQPYTPKTYTNGPNSNAYSDSSDDIYTGSNNTYTSPSGNNSYGNDSGGSREVASGSYKSGDRTYVVNKGDTVFSVMRLTGVYWKEIIKKNNLTPPHTISPGQTLRLK